MGGFVCITQEKVHHPHDAFLEKQIETANNSKLRKYEAVVPIRNGKVKKMEIIKSANYGFFCKNHITVEKTKTSKLPVTSTSCIRRNHVRSYRRQRNVPFRKEKRTEKMGDKINSFKESDSKLNMRELKYFVQFKMERTVSHHRPINISVDSSEYKNLLKNRWSTTKMYSNKNGLLLNQKSITAIKSTTKINIDDENCKSLKKCTEIIKTGAMAQRGIEAIGQVQSAPICNKTNQIKCYSLEQRNNEYDIGVKRVRDTFEEDVVDRDVLKNMEDNIKSFLMEKATNLRNVANKTAAIFEGEGESYTNNCFCQQISSKCRFHPRKRYKKKVFLKTLRENAKNFKKGKNIFTQEQFFFDKIATIKSKENEEILKKESFTTYESIGQKGNIIFSNIRISKDQLSPNKTKKNFQQEAYVVESNVKSNIHIVPSQSRVSFDRNHSKGSSRMDSKASDLNRKSNAKNLFMKCDVFECIGENNDIDCSEMVIALKKHRIKSKKRHMRKRIECNNLGSCSKMNRDHSKVTACGHPSVLCHKHHFIKTLDQELSVLPSEGKSHSYKSDIHSKSIDNTWALGEQDKNEPTEADHESSNNKKQINYCAIGHASLYSINNYSGDNMPDEETKSPQVYFYRAEQSAKQKIIPENGHSLLYNREQSSSDHSQQKQNSENCPNKEKTKEIFSNTDKTNPKHLTLRPVKSLDSVYIHRLPVPIFCTSTYEPHLGSLHTRECRKIHSDSFLSKYIQSEGSHTFWDSETDSYSHYYCSSRDNENKLVSQVLMNTPSPNKEKGELQKEDVYECSGGSSDHLKIMHYVQLRKRPIKSPSQTKSDCIVEFLNSYTLDVSKLGRDASWESIIMKQRTFNSLLKPATDGTNSNNFLQPDIIKPDDTSINNSTANMEKDKSGVKRTKVLNPIHLEPLIMDKSTSTTDRVKICCQGNKPREVVKTSKENLTDLTYSIMNKNKNEIIHCQAVKNKRLINGKYKNDFLENSPILNHNKFTKKKIIQSNANKISHRSFVKDSSLETNEVIKNVKMKFENNFSKVNQKKQPEELTNPARTIWQTLKTGSNKLLNLFYPLNPQ